MGNLGAPYPSGCLRLQQSPAPVAAHSSVLLLRAVAHEHVPLDASGQPEAAKAATCHHIPWHAEEWFPDLSLVNTT